MKLREAITACLPDLEHYAATHGPGPDRRLAELKEALTGSVAKRFHLAEFPSHAELATLGCEYGTAIRTTRVRHIASGQRVLLMARMTGEYRAPRAGEWYLSGAIPEAWRAKADLTTPYRILRLVVCRKVEHLEEV